jgi:hypothetical protein
MRSDVVVCSDSDDDSVFDWVTPVLSVSSADFSVRSDPLRPLVDGSDSVVEPDSDSVSESPGVECSVPWSEPDSCESGSSSVSVVSVESGVPDSVEPLSSEVSSLASSPSVLVPSVVVDFFGSVEGWVVEDAPAVEPAVAPEGADDPVVEPDVVFEPEEVVEVVEPEGADDPVVEPDVVFEPEDVVDVVDFEVVSEDGAVALVFVSEGSANAIAGVVATAIPTPSANANGPTRPMNFPGFI